MFGFGLCRVVLRLISVVLFGFGSLCVVVCCFDVYFRLLWFVLFGLGLRCVVLVSFALFGFGLC